MSEEQTNQTRGSREPPDKSIFQQRMKAWNPILDPVWVTFSLLVLGAAFIPVGLKLREYSDSVVEYSIMYDSYEGMDDAPCGIDKANEKKQCSLTFHIDKDMEKPILVYYEIDNFYQAHRKYAVSRDNKQVICAQSKFVNASCHPSNS